MENRAYQENDRIDTKYLILVLIILIETNTKYLRIGLGFLNNFRINLYAVTSQKMGHYQIVATLLVSTKTFLVLTKTTFLLMGHIPQ